MICSETKVGLEFGRVMQLFIENVYSDDVLLSCIKQKHVPTSIRKKSNTVREQLPRMCTNNTPKMNCDLAIGQHLTMSPECANSYTDDSCRSIGQSRISFHLNCLKSVYIKTQKEFAFSPRLFK